MVAAQLHDRTTAWKQHEAAILGLARELDLPLSDVSQAYEKALQELEAQARIKDFLSVFACRRVRELVRHV